MAEAKQASKAEISSTCRRPNFHHFLCSGYVGHKRKGEPRQVCECACHKKDAA